MANKDAAFGLKAIGKVGQNRDNQGLSEYSIAASCNSDLSMGPSRNCSYWLLIGVAAALVAISEVH